jgi:uncharacterized protein RhaS with RHS repeats
MFYHANSGLYLTHYRAYDPRTARWLSRDPIGEIGGANVPFRMAYDNAAIGRAISTLSLQLTGGDTGFYRYVLGNPINLRDPNGLQWEPSAWDSILGFIGAATVAAEYGTTSVSAIIAPPSAMGALGVGIAAASAGGVVGAGLAGYGAGSALLWAVPPLGAIAAACVPRAGRKAGSAALPAGPGPQRPEAGFRPWGPGDPGYSTASPTANDATGISVQVAL